MKNLIFQIIIIWIKTFLLSIVMLAGLQLTGCSAIMSSRMPDDGLSMTQAYDQAINGVDDNADATIDNKNDYSELPNNSLEQVRSIVNPISQNKINYSTYTRTQENEINNLFPHLPNPNIAMYIYPHETGTGATKTPVPGYLTVFPLYKYTHYDMP